MIKILIVESIYNVTQHSQHCFRKSPSAIFKITDVERDFARLGEEAKRPLFTLTDFFSVFRKSTFAFGYLLTQ